MPQAAPYRDARSCDARDWFVTDSEFRRVMDKRYRLRMLKEARARVRQLERELCGEPAKTHDPPPIPGFLSQTYPVLRKAAEALEPITT